MLEVLLDGRQSDESSDTSKSRYFVSVRSSMLESVVSSVVLLFDAGELVGTSCGKMLFSPIHLAIGERTGDGVLPVRSMVSTIGCICHQKTLMLRWW
jgi:hypothetical protein